MTDDMFTLLKMGSKSYTIDKALENMCEFMRQLCAGYYDEAQNNGLEISVDIPEEHIMVLADYNLLSRAFGNLIENADDGTPIEPEIRNTLFEAFSRADLARKTDGGTGLGLSIAKTIFDKHNWELTYDLGVGQQKDQICNKFTKY